MIPLSLDDPDLLLELEELRLGDIETNSDSSKPDWTPLHWFAVKREADPIRAQARVLLGEDLNAQSDLGDTPLHLATWQRNWEKAKFLLLLGADPLVANQKNETPFHLALRKKDEGLSQLLLPTKPMLLSQEVTAVKAWAAAWGDTKVVSQPAGVWPWLKQLSNDCWTNSAQENQILEELRNDLRAHRLSEALPAPLPSIQRGPRF